jgi:hypothetical protein
MNVRIEYDDDNVQEVRCITKIMETSNCGEAPIDHVILRGEYPMGGTAIYKGNIKKLVITF